MARTPVSTNGIDLESDAPLGTDQALVGDASGDGHIVVDGDEEDDDWDVPAGGKKGQGGAARKPGAADAEGGDFDEEDARLAYSDSDDYQPQDQGDQRGSKRARRNARRREMRTAADTQIAVLQAALEEQGKVIRSLAAGQSSLAVNTVAGQISQLEGSLRIADEEMANAVKTSDGDTYAKAQSIRDRIVGQMTLLRSQKDRMDAAVVNEEDLAGGGQAQPQQQQRQAQQVDPRVTQAVENHFDRFCDRFPWFDPDSTDPDSNIVRAIDQHLIRQGYQRHTPVFWQEMERTMATRYRLVPDKGEGGDNDDAGNDGLPPPRRQEQRGGPMGRGGQRPPTSAGRSGSNGRGGFHLDATQTSMLRDEGLIGDNLSKEDAAKRDRIVGAWRKGSETLRKQGARQ